MGIRLCSVVSQSKQILKLQSLLTRPAPAIASIVDVPKGHCAVYVGETEKKRFTLPVSYLNHPIFQELLSRAEEELGFDHPMGGLTITCKEVVFINLTSQLNGGA
ncbi:auxin-responsive protein SAUR23-like [Papaver somniferum]|uniref:auxin-responsive protein SAUR23-like n=1 Tax=Papaver somniferum TaxID=3469 RepID=UPI000E6FBF02|nr:auxin-responsive protein SAUR23-like [Papaver somniferum]